MNEFQAMVVTLKPIEPAQLIISADEIDNRIGPIPGRSSDRIARELRAAASLIKAIVGEWRPIDTAPNNYDVILLYQPAGPNTAEAVGQGHRTSLHPHAHDKWIFQANGWIAEPTHWMPLPSPPVRRHAPTEDRI